MIPSKILIIEDELPICDILSYSLRKEGYEVKYEHSGKVGLVSIEEFKPELIILDLMLPDISGFDLCKLVNEKYKIPIMMLTARNDIEDKVKGLELGADDYITKPFDVREVIARVKTALRRIERLTESSKNKTIIKLKQGLEINLESRVVLKDKEEIKLKPREYELLVALAENRGRVLTREQLLDLVWSMDYEGDFRTVDIHVQRLRKKLDLYEDSLIETVFGVGYKMR